MWPRTTFHTGPDQPDPRPDIQPFWGARGRQGQSRGGSAARGRRGQSRGGSAARGRQGESRGDSAARGQQGQSLGGSAACLGGVKKKKARGRPKSQSRRIRPAPCRKFFLRPRLQIGRAQKLVRRGELYDACRDRGSTFWATSVLRG